MSLTMTDIIDLLERKGGRLLVYEAPGGTLETVEAKVQGGQEQPIPAEAASVQEEPLKLNKWTAITGLSRRELDRAVEHGALPHHRKKDGRDAGAVMVHGGDMADYLRLCDAVQAGRTSPPAWWHDVRLGRAAEVAHAA